MALFSAQRLWQIAITAHFMLLALVISWQGFISPHPHVSSLTMTGVWTIPLLLPLIGMLKQKAYTHAWANFVLMLYFLHSLTIIATNVDERSLAIVELILTSTLFGANILFTRTKGREQGLGLPRLSKVEKQEAEKFKAQ